MANLTVVTSPPGVWPKTTASIADTTVAQVTADVLRKKSGDLAELIDAQDQADATAKAANKAPTVTAWTGNLSVVHPATATFNVTATATPSPEYRWYKTAPNGPRTLVAGNVTSTLTTAATVVGDNGTVYEVEVRNYKGTIVKTANLTVT